MASLKGMESRRVTLIITMKIIYIYIYIYILFIKLKLKLKKKKKKKRKILDGVLKRGTNAKAISPRKASSQALSSLLDMITFSLQEPLNTRRTTKFLLQTNIKNTN